MYIETYWVVIIAIWIIYLLWRVEHLKSVLRQAGNLFEYYQKKKEGLERDLVRMIVYFDSKLTARLPKKTQDKILSEQANELRCHFRNNYAESVSLDGKLTPVEDEPMDRLGNILECPILDSETHTDLNITFSDTVQDIKEGLECMIDNYK
jgi:hypothetical protein